jgi:hypothetical protein
MTDAQVQSFVGQNVVLKLLANGGPMKGTLIANGNGTYSLISNGVVNARVAGVQADEISSITPA